MGQVTHREALPVVPLGIGGERASLVIPRTPPHEGFNAGLSHLSALIQPSCSSSRVEGVS